MSSKHELFSKLPYIVRCIFTYIFNSMIHIGGITLINIFLTVTSDILMILLSNMELYSVVFIQL